MIAGVAHATDWMAIIFNPSMPCRFVHMMLASFLTVCFLIAGVSAFRWIIGGTTEGVRVALKTAVFGAALLMPVQIFVGDMHGLNTLEHQPQKIAAMEGNWESNPTPRCCCSRSRTRRRARTGSRLASPTSPRSS